MYDAGMRRALLTAIVTLLMADASGLSSLLVPETCAFESSDSAPDSGCPAFCVRCNCACCVSSIEHRPVIDVVAMDRVPPLIVLTPSVPTPLGVSAEILHVPKPVLS